MTNMDDLQFRVYSLEKETKQLQARIKDSEKRPGFVSELFAIWIFFCVVVGISRFMGWVAW